MAEKIDIFLILKEEGNYFVPKKDNTNWNTSYLYIYTPILCLLAFGAEEFSLGGEGRFYSLTLMPTSGQLTIWADFTLWFCPERNFFGDRVGSTLLNWALEASSYMDSEIFSVSVTTSISIEATVTPGITFSRSMSSHMPDLSKDLIFLAADFAFSMWESAEDGCTIILIANASSLSDFPDSLLIFVHASWIMLLTSDDACNNKQLIFRDKHVMNHLVLLSIYVPKWYSFFFIT